VCERSGTYLDGAQDVVIGRYAIAIRSSTTSASGRLASNSCEQPALSSGSTSARSSKIISRSAEVLPKSFVVLGAIRSKITSAGALSRTTASKRS
jgi:hypothetical protein